MGSLVRIADLGKDRPGAEVCVNPSHVVLAEPEFDGRFTLHLLGGKAVVTNHDGVVRLLASGEAVPVMGEPRPANDDPATLGGSAQ